MKADDMILVSVDDHICEPPGHVRCPRARQLQGPGASGRRRSERGVQQWWYGDIEGPQPRAERRRRQAARDTTTSTRPATSEMRPGCYDVHERVRDMSPVASSPGSTSRTGPASPARCSTRARTLTVNDIMIKAYNDWHVDEWCGAYPDRFIPCGMLPLFDVEQAAAEIRRLAAKGCHAVTFSERPEALQMPSIHSGYWDPLFAACCDEGTVLCAHVGSSSQGRRRPRPTHPPRVRWRLSSVRVDLTPGRAAVVRLLPALSRPAVLV